jgi:serine phosphatase RsbU (regulator of sigma subunit)
LAYPAVLTTLDLSASAVPWIQAANPALRELYDAGVRLLVPLRVADRQIEVTGTPRSPLVGIWALGAPKSGDLPDREDLAAATRVGEHAALLLDYARLGEEQLQQEVVRREVERGRRIQQQLLPPPHPGWPRTLDVATRLQPAQNLSGDFYDLVELSHSTSSSVATGELTDERALYVAVGDVKGKGLDAALIATMAVAALRSAIDRIDGSSTRDSSPAAILEQVSRLLNRSIALGNYVCCALACVEAPVDPSHPPGLRLANAGQVPPWLFRAGSCVELVPPGERLPMSVPHD